MFTFTTADIEAMYRNDEWEGFGYLGERRNALTTSYDHAAQLEDVAKADAKALEDANRNSLTHEEFFAWANSRTGRYYGDCMFGANGTHADTLLPSRFVGLA